MIVSIRGTSGSGKSTLARAIMALYNTKEPLFEKGRKQPMCYRLWNTKKPSEVLHVLGHYETACGGCDTIQAMDTVFGLADELASEGHVLFEGLLLAADVKRTLELNNKHPGQLRVYMLDTPLETCLKQVNARRRARNPDLPPVNPVNTTSKYNGVLKSYARLKEHGVDAFHLPYNQIYNDIRELLHV